MDQASQGPSKPTTPRSDLRVGCVSYLNAKPLIDGLEEELAHPIRFDVPAHLARELEHGRVDLALCPVIDYFRSDASLCVLPVGGIGCQGRTLTVRLFSRLPIASLTEVYADTDSHTSVALLRILLREITGRDVTMRAYHAREHVSEGRLVTRPDAMLLIGDKVVTGSPPAYDYPHQMDLGEAWRASTGLPFVFATWFCRTDVDLGDLPERLERVLNRNLQRLPELAAQYAPRHGWPTDLALEYMRDILSYRMGEDPWRGMQLYGAKAAAMGLCPPGRELVRYQADVSSRAIKKSRSSES